VVLALRVVYSSDLLLGIIVSSDMCTEGWDLGRKYQVFIGVLIRNKLTLSLPAAHERR